jgi:hypothetical protein
VTKIISLTFENLVTPKAGAKHELLFNKLASAALTRHIRQNLPGTYSTVYYSAESMKRKFVTLTRVEYPIKTFIFVVGKGDYARALICL